jgi:hypothetical protein
LLDRTLSTATGNSSQASQASPLSPIIIPPAFIGQTPGAETIPPASSGTQVAGLTAPPSVVVSEVADMNSASDGASEIGLTSTNKNKSLGAPSPSSSSLPPPATLTPLSSLHLDDGNEMESEPLIEKGQQGKHRRCIVVYIHV